MGEKRKLDQDDVKSLDTEPLTKKAKTKKSELVELTVYGCTEDPNTGQVFTVDWGAMARWCGDDEHESVFQDGEVPAAGKFSLNEQYKKPIASRAGFLLCINMIQQPWSFLDTPKDNGENKTTARQFVEAHFWAAFLPSTKLMKLLQQRILGCSRQGLFEEADAVRVHEHLNDFPARSVYFVDMIQACAKDNTAIMRGMCQVPVDVYTRYIKVIHAVDRFLCPPRVDAKYVSPSGAPYTFLTTGLARRVLLEADSNVEFDIKKYRAEKIKKHYEDCDGRPMTTEEWDTLKELNGLV